MPTKKGGRKQKPQQKLKGVENMSNDTLEKIIADELNFPEDDSWHKITFNKYIKNPPDIYKFTKHLIELLSELPPDEELLLFLFLQTTFHYVNECQPESDFDFISLCLMADSLKREQAFDDDIEEPLYDVFLKEVIRIANLRDHNELKYYYELFNETRNEYSPDIITNHIWTIICNFKPPEDQ